MDWHVITVEAFGEGVSAALETKAAALELARTLQADGMTVVRLEATDGDVVSMQAIEPDPLESAPAGRRRKRQPPQQTTPAGRWNR
ncbi:hypothetical protein [Beijerinckia sp. L45]|uniref:hypothetical protein n=1 Tax=Beijerinckia sp. L45 TaxID=1641855 RepID=UPI00131E3CED|nr:hypothetical protein [Beijerinckia sp. L45]